MGCWELYKHVCLASRSKNLGAKTDMLIFINIIPSSQCVKFSHKSPFFSDLTGYSLLSFTHSLSHSTIHPRATPEELVLLYCCKEELEEWPPEPVDCCDSVSVIQFNQGVTPWWFNPEQHTHVKNVKDMPKTSQISCPFVVGDCPKIPWRSKTKEYYSLAKLRENIKKSQSLPANSEKIPTGNVYKLWWWKCYKGICFALTVIGQL